MLRAFLPETTETRAFVDFDGSYSSYPYSTSVNVVAGRFADTSGIAVSNAIALYLSVGFRRALEAAAGLFTYRAAFDLYLVQHNAVVPLLTVVPTSEETNIYHQSYNAATSWISLRFNPTSGQLDLYSRGVFVASSRQGGGPFTLNIEEYYRIEVRADIEAVGLVEVWVNDILVINGDDESGGTIDVLGAVALTENVWSYMGPRYASRFGNIILWDDSGVAGDDLIGFLGDVTPVKLLPAADGDTVESVATGGDRYAVVADADGADFISLGGNGDLDLYQMATMTTISTGSIRAVIVTADGFLTGNGDARLTAVCKDPNATTTITVGTITTAPLTTYVAPRAVLACAFPTNPDTGVAWASATEVNNSQFGVKAVIT